MNAQSPLEPDSDLILDHVRSPYHRGYLSHPTCSKVERNPLCGDQIELQLQIQSRRIHQAYFDGRGCAVSLAAASLLCEHLEGQLVEVAFALQPETMLALLQIPLSPTRQQCALLAFRALKAMLTENNARGSST